MSTVLRSTTFQLAFNGADGLQGIKSFTRAVKDADATVDKLNEQLGENATVTYKSVRSKKELTAEARALVSQMERSIVKTKNLTLEYEHQISLLGKSTIQQAALNATYKLGANATDAQKNKVVELASSFQRLYEEEELLNKASIDRITSEAKIEKQLEQSKQRYAELVSELHRYTAMVGKSSDEQEIDNQLHKLGANATEEQKTKVTQLTTSLLQLRENTKLANDAKRVSNAESEKSITTTSSLVSQYSHMASVIDKTGEELAILNAMQRLGVSSTMTQREQVTQSIKSYYALTAAQNGQQGSMRNSRGIMQNFGWQMQDTIVQLQMGTSAFVVLSQQGSQMAAAFGPTGAVVGAVIALAGVVGGTLFAGLMNTTKATETLEKATTSISEVMKIAADGTLSFTEEMEKLYEVDSKLAKLRMTAAIFDANKSIKESGKGITEAFDEIGVSWYNLTVNDLVAGGKSLDFINTLTKQITGLKEGSKGFTEAGNRVRFLVGTMEQLKSQGAGVGTIQRVGEALESVSTVVSKDNDKFNEFVKNTIKMVVSFKEGKTTAVELQKAMDDLGGSIKNNSKKTKDGVNDIIKAFESEYNSLTKQTESIQEEYSRRKSIIDDFVNQQGKTDEKSKSAYSKLNEWRKTELDKLETKQNTIDAARAKALDKSFVSLFNSLIKATNSTSQEYDKRKDIIDDHVARVGSIDAEAALAYAALEEWKTDQLQRAYDKRETIRKTIERAQVRQGSKSGDRNSEDSLFERNLLALAAQKRAIGEDELAERQRIDGLIESEVTRHNQAITDSDRMRIENQVQTIGLAVNMMSSLTNLMTNGVQQVRDQTAEMNGFQKTMFIMSQIMAASMALIDGISLGMKLANMFSNPALAIVGTSLGAAQAGAIMGVTLAGAFDNGGDIPAGQMGIVSEYGDELVNGQLIQGPARVTSRKDTAQLLKEGNSGTSNVTMKVMIENKIPNATYDVQQIDEDTVKVIAYQVFSKNIDSGVSSVMNNRNSKSSKSMRSQYNVKSKL